MFELYRNRKSCVPLGGANFDPIVIILEAHKTMFHAKYHRFSTKRFLKSHSPLWNGKF
jgi:hypothetical protein